MGNNTYNGVDTSKDYFTTNDLAKICGVNIASIKNWVKAGKFGTGGTFRTPGGHLRIRRSAAQDFMRRHPFAPNAFNSHKILFVTKEPDKLESAVTKVREHTGHETITGFRLKDALPFILDPNQSVTIVIDYDTMFDFYQQNPNAGMLSYVQDSVADVIVYHKHEVPNMKVFGTSFLYVRKEFRYTNLLDAIDALIKGA